MSAWTKLLNTRSDNLRWLIGFFNRSLAIHSLWAILAMRTYVCMFRGRPSVAVSMERDTINRAKERDLSKEFNCPNCPHEQIVGCLAAYFALYTGLELRNHSRPFCNWSFRQSNR